ncbi:cysteine hydrolase family protein [Roseateles oligotrophus]|uniref:Cysteine hydrolase n=1 Tax=Roseateles oligotrophus TaxID=1769250 RepID=A0ABT2YHI5_9BURK|nr:cysteine hydrolase family protein [Roseateles oligotrophus]MCV2369477.1 cysteine hydrolase [Roseateles oligotrophus]
MSAHNKSALLIIDVQRGLFDAEPRPFEADAVVARINALAAKARAAGAPIIFIQHEREASALTHGSDGWALERGLVVMTGDQLLRKTTPDSFLRTDLLALLQGFGCEHVVICGYATEFCVDTTTRRAAALGFSVTLAADAHTTHDKAHASAAQIRAHHNATLPDITSFGPRIAATASTEIEF